MTGEPTGADCDSSARQDWTVRAGGTIQVNGECMDLYRDEKRNKTPVELRTCTGGANQKWHAVNGTLVNPDIRQMPGRPEIQYRWRHPAGNLHLRRRLQPAMETALALGASGPARYRSMSRSLTA